MSRAIKLKKKVKKESLNEGNKDVFGIFQDTMSMNGTMNSFKIIYAKYLEYAKQFSRYLTLFKMFSTHKLMTPFKIAKMNLFAYTKKLDQTIKSTFSFRSLNIEHPPTKFNKLNGDAIDYDAVPQDQIDEFTEFYDTIRDCELIHQMISTCTNLLPHRKSFQDIDNLNSKFLFKLPGVDYSPIEDLNLNIKEIYIDDTTSESAQRVIMTILNRLYNITHEIYQLSTSPDIDVNDFIRIVKDSISKLKSQIPRCGDAFKKIEESIDLLRGNFKDYYKDFRESGNPTVIMENFVVDVSRSTKGSARLAFQFKKIIQHYQKIAANKSQDPRLKVLFQQFDRNMAALNKSDSADADEEDSDDDIPNLQDVVNNELAELLHLHTLVSTSGGADAAVEAELASLDETSPP